ncbi:MAG TPA: N-ethylammeline chlorohydrolase [Kiritimatiellae bacterium]|nr:N-ethylammeline chlorohydrolase [Kiritimatiellia bacterium]
MTKKILIRNARIWPNPAADTVLNGSILVEDGVIRKLGAVAPEDRASADVIDAEGRLVMPGLVQTHVHLCQTLMRGAAEDLPLLRWLRDYIWPLEAAHDHESLRVSALLACAALIRSGTTTVMTFETVRGTEVAFEAVAEVGLMGHISHCFMDNSGGYAPLAVPLADSFRACERILRRWGGHPDLRLAIAPRFALSSTPQSLKEVAKFARENHLLLHTHASEQRDEVEEVQRRTGYSNVEFLDELGILGPDVCLVHCVHVEPQEMQRMAETNTRVIHCPSANLKLGSGIAPITEYVERGLIVSLGADGAPCNNRLDAFTEMRAAALLQKIRSGPSALPARKIVEMAIIGGAITLRWDHEIGVLRPGMRANLIMLERSWQAVPTEEPASRVVYGHNSEDVCLTMVNGKVLYRDGRLLTIDEDRLERDVTVQRRLLFERAGLR